MVLELADRRIDAQQFELHVFELAYVLSLMGVESVATLPDSVFFPADPALRKKVLGEGEKRLIADGLIVPGDVPGEASYNDELLSTVAAVADPRFTILTRRETREGKRADATIFFNNVEIVEMTQVQRQVFRLRRLTDSAAAFQQVRKLLGVSASLKHENAAAELRIEAFESVRRRVKEKDESQAQQELVEAGLAADAADELVAALSTPDRKGVVSVLKHVAQKVADVRVMGFYLRDGSTWITSVVSESTREVRVEAVDANSFVHRLVDRVASICA
ncbi:hypothetical protein OAS39_06460 [Pirellulales bacterium]|nr:hypothetical protein [Pirellulales bacterium]